MWRAFSTFMAYSAAICRPGAERRPLQHDLFHIYPGDDHILMVLRDMRRLAMDPHGHATPVGLRR